MYVQIGLVVVLLVALATAVAMTMHWNDLVSQAAQRTSPDPETVDFERASNVVGGVVVGGISLVLALWFAALVVPVWRGSQVARILALVGTGVPLLCGLRGCGFMAFPLLGGSAFAPEDIEGSEFDSGDAFYRELDSLASGFGWWMVALAVVVFVAIACAVTLAVLLLVPSSNRFYRPPRPRPVVQYVPVPYPVYSVPAPPRVAPPGVAPPGQAAPGAAPPETWTPPDPSG